MANISYQLDQNATISKILNGEMPNGITPEDTIVLISDDVLRIYMHLLSGLLFRTVPEEAPKELSDRRIAIFDAVMTAINNNKAGRLYKFLDALNDAVKEYQTDPAAWPNTKMRNNVFSFISDFWIWNEDEKNQLLVIVEMDLDAVAEGAAAEEQPAPVEGEIAAE